MTTDTPRTYSWATRLIPAATFVIGLLIGLLVVLVGPNDDDSALAPVPSPSASTASTSPSPGDVTVTVPAACRQAADNLREATSLLRQVVGSVKNFAPDQLVRLLNRMETLDSRTRPLVKRCSAVDVSATSPTPTP